MTVNNGEIAVFLSIMKNNNNPSASMDDIKKDAKELMEFIHYDLEIVFNDQYEKLQSKYSEKSQ